MRQWVRFVVAGLAGAVVVAQFIPMGHGRTNPPVRAEPPWDSPRTRALFFDSCGDCHSNETRWPWYSAVAPASWLVVPHVHKGRRHLNVSEWSPEAAKAAHEAEEEIRRGKMPLASYVRAHPNARLDATEKAELIRGLTSTLAQAGHTHD
jgi:hypothetical protein